MQVFKKIEIKIFINFSWQKKKCDTHIGLFKFFKFLAKHELLRNWKKKGGPVINKIVYFGLPFLLQTTLNKKLKKQIFLRNHTFLPQKGHVVVNL